MENITSEHIIIDEYGIFLGKKSRRLVIKEKGTTTKEIPFFKISQVTITGNGIIISSDLIKECTRREIQINFLSKNEKPYAQISSPYLRKKAVILRKQLQVYESPKALILAKRIIEAKITNQIILPR